LDKSHSVKAIHNQITNEKYRYYILYFDKLSIGYLGVARSDDALIICKLYILKSFRGKEIGKMALLFVEEMARNTTIFKIELTVHKHNQKAIDFYTKSKYKIVDSLFHKFENGHSLQGFKMTKLINE
jgi:ribosomal protein S18 acetylase RimI-like enzyme